MMEENQANARFARFCSEELSRPSGARDSCCRVPSAEALGYLDSPFGLVRENQRPE